MNFDFKKIIMIVLASVLFVMMLPVLASVIDSEYGEVECEVRLTYYFDETSTDFSNIEGDIEDYFIYYKDEVTSEYRLVASLGDVYSIENTMNIDSETDISISFNSQYFDSEGNEGWDIEDQYFGNIVHFYDSGVLDVEYYTNLDILLIQKN